MRKGLALVMAIVAVTARQPLLAAQTVVDQWRYTFTQPKEAWQTPTFNDAEWMKGTGGFGSPETPNVRIGTEWRTPSIWLRKRFALTGELKNPALFIHHDDDAEIFINGQPALSLTGYTAEYKVIPLKVEQRALLKTGDNVLAIQCKQKMGGQFIDAHVIEADAVPVLPAQERKPFVSALITPWGEKVTDKNVWQEYPRPQMRRERWQNLNGYWQYAVTPDEQQETPQAWQGKILVPFCLESKLGGVQKMLQDGQALWYRRTFSLQPTARTLLNFEAVDYRCKVLVNGKPVGEHRGGNTPFSIDITSAVSRGDNEVVVRVEDGQEGFQLRGKQTKTPQGIWYTQVSGIWQTVWLEQVGTSHISDLTIRTDAATGTIKVSVKAEGAAREVTLQVNAGDKLVTTVTGAVGQEIEAKVADAKLWSPTSPFLYDLDVALRDGAGHVADSVASYAGIRTVGKRMDAQGHLRFTLNGKDIFHWGPLDQGWWPDGLLTPPSNEAIAFEIGWLKRAGFNMIRKHIKVEPRRYYYECDRQGMMMWQDQVSAGKGPPWTFLNPNPKDADWPDECHAQFMTELDSMIDNLENHPSIVCWVPFNEAWGQHRTVEVGKWVMQRDPSRLVNIASGGNFWPVGDIVDAHNYPHPGFPFDQGKNGRFDGFIKVVGEFGGHGYPVKGHLWDDKRNNWGYGGLPKDKAEYKERFAISIQKLNDLRPQGVAGGVYTQTTDVEGEINGLMTYDRKVVKIPAEEVAELTSVLFK